MRLGGGATECRRGCSRRPILLSSRMAPRQVGKGTRTPMSRPRNCTPKSKPSPGGSPTGGSGAAAGKRSRRNSDKPHRARAVAYVRESTEEQGKGFSPDAQREAIRRFAEENELELVDDYCDFHSGWKQADGRPEFQACGGFS